MKIEEEEYWQEEEEFSVSVNKLHQQVPDATSYETECLEAFADPTMGGIALALPHGSILVEIAKAEFQAQAVQDRACVLSAQEPSLRQSWVGRV